jgi:uncharacterized protein (TIGR03437 family)
MKYTLFLMLFTLLTHTAHAQTITVRNFLNPDAPPVREALVLIEGTNFTDTERIEPFNPLTELEGVRVTVDGVLQRIRSVSPTQVVFIVDGRGAGVRSVQLRTKSNVIHNATMRVATIWPGLFVLSTGEDSEAFIPAALWTTDGFQQNPVSSEPIPVGPPNRPTFVIVQGSGFRNAASFGGARVRLNGIPAPVVSVGPSLVFAGQDELVFQIPSFLAGRGVMELRVTVAGRESNYTRINLGDALPAAARAARVEANKTSSR